MFLDTTVVIEILQLEEDSRRFDTIYDLLKDEPIFISVVQLGEISDWCLSNGIEVSECIQHIKDVTNILPINEGICIEGSKVKHEMRNLGITKFSLMDGLILASARSVSQKLLTTDSDFRRAEDVIIID